jgi:hypothetical protein
MVNISQCTIPQRRLLTLAAAAGATPTGCLGGAGKGSGQSLGRSHAHASACTQAHPQSLP